MGVKWVKGNPNTLRASLEAHGEKAVAAAESALRETVKQAAYDIQRIIVMSETDTGLRRAAAGAGEAGRIETREMYDAVKSKIEFFGADSASNTIVGSFGWLEDTSEKILQRAIWQDQGTEKVAGMMALFQVYVVAVNELKRRLAEKGFKVS